MFFVEARYHHSPKRAADQVRYIAHREIGLQGGEHRELYGIGARYRAFRGDEKAIGKALGSSINDVLLSSMTRICQRCRVFGSASCRSSR